MYKKPSRSKLAVKVSDRRVLQLSHETVRTLTADELSRAASGCPTDSWPTDKANSGAC